MRYFYRRRFRRYTHRNRHDSLRNGIYTCGKHNLLFSTFNGFVFHKINKHILAQERDQVVTIP